MAEALSEGPIEISTSFVHSDIVIASQTRVMLKSHRSHLYLWYLVIVSPVGFTSQSNVWVPRLAIFDSLHSPANFPLLLQFTVAPGSLQALCKDLPIVCSHGTNGTITWFCFKLTVDLGSNYFFICRQEGDSGKLCSSSEGPDQTHEATRFIQHKTL